MSVNSIVFGNKTRPKDPEKTVTDNALETQTVNQEETPVVKPVATPQDNTPYSGGLSSMLAKNPYEAPETAEQKASREKRERLTQTIAGIGDLLSSASNLYYASKGAQIPTNEVSMSAKVNDRIEQLRKEREANIAGYRKYVQDAVLQQDKARNAREQIRLKQQQLKQQADAQARKDKLAEEEAARKKERHDLDVTYKTNRNAAQEQEAKDKHDNIVARTNKINNTPAGGSRSNRQKTTYSVDGKTYEKLEDAYANLPQDVRRKAERGGKKPDKKQVIADYAKSKTQKRDVSSAIVWD